MSLTFRHKKDDRDDFITNRIVGFKRTLFKMAANGSMEQDNTTSTNQLETLFSQVISASQLPQTQETHSQQVGEQQVLDKELFLQTLREYKCLWDTSDSNYKNRNMKLNAWNALSQIFSQEGEHFSQVPCI